MPPSVTVAAFVLGVILLVAAIIGQGFQLNIFTVPHLSRGTRLALGGLGAFFVYVGLFDPFNTAVLAPDNGSTPTAPTPQNTISTSLPTASVVAIEATSTPTTARDFNVSFDVHADRSWQNTGIEITNKDVLDIAYISGSWTENTKDTPLSGPEGIKPSEDYPCGMPMSHKDTGYNALIGRIGEGKPFKIGGTFQQTSADEGNLFLRMNDCDDHLTDNKGIITVNITITR
jgi:hypothetical protein